MVKQKIKRLNEEIKRLNVEINNNNYLIKRLNNVIKQKNEYIMKDKTAELKEDIIKFLISNQIEALKGGVSFSRLDLQRMKDLNLNIEYQEEFDRYFININFKRW